MVHIKKKALKKKTKKNEWVRGPDRKHNPHKNSLETTDNLEYEFYGEDDK